MSNTTQAITLQEILQVFEANSIIVKHEESLPKFPGEYRVEVTKDGGRILVFETEESKMKIDKRSVSYRFHKKALIYSRIAREAFYLLKKESII